MILRSFRSLNQYLRNTNILFNIDGNNAVPFYSRISVDDLKAQKMFLVNAKVALCLDKNKACVFEVPIMKDIKLPKPLCNLEASLSLPSEFPFLIKATLFRLSLGRESFFIAML